MSFITLAYFILASFGLTQILVYGSVFDRIRPCYAFFHCSMCIGWWVGVFLWAINGFTELFIFDYSVGTAFVLACISSGSSYVLDVIVGDKGINLKMWGDEEC